MPDLLSRLTADRLEELAGICDRRIAGINETAKMIGATTDDTRTRMGADLALYSQLAAVVRTLAGAERITDLEINNAGKVWYAISPHDGFVQHEASTLIAALTAAQSA
jgi:hypothetical protein